MSSHESKGRGKIPFAGELCLCGKNSRFYGLGERVIRALVLDRGLHNVRRVKMTILQA